MFDPMMPQGSGRAALWFSALAFLISILSFAAASTQTWLTYQHNRLSVMPKLDWREAYGDPTTPQLEITLINAGLGPAKVSDIKITVNSTILPIADGRACDHLNALIGAVAAQCFIIPKDDWVFVKPNDTLVLYRAGTPKAATVDLTGLDAIGVSARQGNRT